MFAPKRLTLKRLNSLIQKIKFDPYDSFYTILIDPNTSVDYCLTKVVELTMHLRADNTIDKIKDIIAIIRILLITLHKIQKDKGDE